MSDWNEYKIKELVRKEANSFIDGDWIEAPYITDRGIRLIQTGNIGVGLFVNKNKKYISENSFNSLRCKEIFPGDLLICRLADPIGRGCIVPDLKERYITSVDVAILRIDEDHFEKNLIIQVINNDEFLAKCNEVSGGSTRQRISRKNLGEIGVLLPRIKEQRKIAKILTTVDNLIEKTQTLIDKYQSIKQGMMHDLFTRGVDQNGKLRPTYEEAPHLYKESELGWIPKEWLDVKFRDICTVNQGLQIAITQRFKTLNPDRHVYITLQYLNNPQDLVNTYYIEETNSAIICSSDDILMTRTGNTGMVVTNASGVFHNNFFKVNYDRKNDRDYIVYFLERPEIQIIIMNNAGVTTIPDLNHNDFYQLPFHKPEPQEQKRISDRLNKLGCRIGREVKFLSKLKSIKQGLMQDLLTGKVRVKVEEEEVT